MEYFFSVSERPKLTKEQGSEFFGWCQTGNGQFVRVEFTFRKRCGFKPVFSLLIDDQVGNSVCLDCVVQCFDEIPLKRQRVGSNVTSLNILRVLCLFPDRDSSTIITITKSSIKLENYESKA